MQALVPVAAVLLLQAAAAQTPLAKPAPATVGSHWTPPRTPDGHIDFQGIWTNATVTPLERPASLKDKAMFTPAEAAGFEKQVNSENVEGNFQSRGVGTYNIAFRELGNQVVKTLRTSMIIDPPEGKLPALTPAAAAEKRRRQDMTRHPDGSQDLGLQDQCLMFPTGAPPMTPYTYNSNYRFTQTKNEVAIYVEMVHDTRIVPLDGRPHLPDSIRLWYGDSVGHWEGDTLVVDTTNFNDKTSFFGSDRNMHVVERFSLMDADTILYQFEVDDPTAFTKPFKGENTIARAPGPIYEYACHEGNYAVPGVLRGFRTDETAEMKSKGAN